MTDVRRAGRMLPIGLAVAVVPTLAACRQPADRTVIAVLTPVTPGALATEPGRSAFLERVTSRCDACVVRDEYDGATAASARVAVADGADVIVVEALTSEVGEDVVVAAGRVPVVAFDRFVPGADWFVGYDHSETSTAVVDTLARQVGDEPARGGDGVLVILDGSTGQADPATRGLRERLAARGLEVSAELAAVTGTADEARGWVLDQLDRLDRAGRVRLAAVIAATDEQARGVVEAFKEARLPRPWPLVTGVGGDLDAVRRVVGGDQTLTVHMPAARTAELAADVALSLASVARGSDLTGSEEVEGVPSYVHEPVVVSVATVTNTVVRDGTFTPEEICPDGGDETRERDDLAAACARLGIR